MHLGKIGPCPDLGHIVVVQIHFSHKLCRRYKIAPIIPNKNHRFPKKCNGDFISPYLKLWPKLEPSPENPLRLGIRSNR